MANTGKHLLRGEKRTLFSTAAETMINCLIMIDRLKRSSDLIFSVFVSQFCYQCQCEGDEDAHFGVGMISDDDDSVLPVLVMIKFVPRDTVQVVLKLKHQQH